MHGTMDLRSQSLSFSKQLVGTQLLSVSSIYTYAIICAYMKGVLVLLGNTPNRVEALFQHAPNSVCLLNIQKANNH